MKNINIIQEDITNLAVDGIVNAANSSLLGGGGVDGAIHRAAGPELLAECRKLNGCATGHAKLTQGYQLPAKYVIHTVGPVWHGGKQNEAKLLASCYQQSLQLAEQKQLKSIAFPAISCGVYGYPLEQAAKIAVKTVQHFMQQQAKSLQTVYFVCFNDEIAKIYKKLLAD